jgi:hypothetical protein
MQDDASSQRRHPARQFGDSLNRNAGAWNASTATIIR